MFVLDQCRIPLIGFAADEAVEPVIAETQRPVLAVRADVEGIDGHVVVLAPPESAPAGIAKHRRDRREWKGESGAFVVLPPQKGPQPASRSTVAIVAFSGGMCPE